MGWLGWTEAETLDTSMPAICLAYEGRMDMLKKTFGAEKPVEPESPQEEIPQDPRLAARLLFDRIRRAAD